ncbi:MAG: hypothetical protein K2J40_04135 [Ruminococcus sp.]|nr:hypothetical protein [Ruminococcus sp.]
MKLWDSFLEMLSDRNNLFDYRTYYSATVQWFKEHIYCFTPEIISINNLDFLLSLDIDGYITESPDIQLETEYERLKKLNPSSKHTVAMLIADILREMISIKSGTDCPVCGNEMIYAVDNRNFLSCDICGYCMAENT